MLSDLLDRPMNSLVNEAVKVYVHKCSLEVERELEADLARLRAYRERDPNFEGAIAQFVEAEVAGTDPVEGKPAPASGPVQAEVDQLLNARLGR